MAIGIRALLVAIEKALNEGRQEAEAAAVEVLLGLAEDAVKRAEISVGRGTVPPQQCSPSSPWAIKDAGYRLRNLLRGNRLSAPIRQLPNNRFRSFSTLRTRNATLRR
jgi:hypothetical protein